MNETILHKIFSRDNFTTTELEKIIPSFKKVEFSKKEYLLNAGKTATYYYFVESGYIRSFAVDVDGNDVTTGFYGRTDIVIDWPSFFLRTPTKEYTQALTDCVCWQLGFSKFQQLFHSIENFREAGRTRLVSSYFELKRKSIAMITEPAKDRYLGLMREKPGLVHNVSLKHIATYLGITDTSLSRIRKEIAKS